MELRWDKLDDEMVRSKNEPQQRVYCHTYDSARMDRIEKRVDDL